MPNYKKIFFFISIVLICPQLAFAALSLSVNPVDGSNTLRLKSAIDGIEEGKELRIRINATDGQRYQVFQRLNEPLTNEKGETLDTRALKAATIVNSNTAGSLYLQSVESLGMGEQLVYTSAEAGNSDSFVIVYTLDSAALNASGNFLGRLVLTVRALGEAAQEQATVNISVESQQNWKVEVTGGRSKSQVRVKDSDVSAQNTDFTKILFTGGDGQEIKIYQELDTLPGNAAGVEMEPDVLQLAVEGAANQGVRVVASAPVSNKRVLLYSGREKEASFAVKYFVNAEQVSDQDAGIYAGKLKYVVETEQGREELLMDFECNIQPIFTVDVTLPPEGISFDHILFNSPPVEHEVSVTVRTNLHRPYQVVQELQSPMTNEKGDQIKKEYFTLKVELPAGDKGHTKFSDYLSLETGSYPVFSSDSKGSPATFKVFYRLQGYPQISAGNFSAPIRFSLNQD